MKTKYVFISLLLLAVFSAYGQTDPKTGRPLKASADVASDKPNVPVKKESFADKLSRYGKEGFKVAVYVSIPDSIFSKGADPNALSSTATVGTIPLYGGVAINAEDFAPLANKFAASMNAEFNTDVFEAVDIMQIPIKYGMFDIGLSNWGITKYKMAITYTVSPIYDYTFFMDKYKGFLQVTQNVMGTEYVNEKKGVKMKYPIRAGNLGTYESPIFESEEDPKISKTEEIHLLVNAPFGADLVAELSKLQDESMAKFIEKRIK